MADDAIIGELIATRVKPTISATFVEWSTEVDAELPIVTCSISDGTNGAGDGELKRHTLSSSIGGELAATLHRHEIEAEAAIRSYGAFDRQAHKVLSSSSGFPVTNGTFVYNLRDHRQDIDASGSSTMTTSFDNEVLTRIFVIRSK